MREVAATTEGKMQMGPGTLYGSIKRMLQAGLIAEADERMAEAIDLVDSKRDGDGWWPLEVRYPDEMPIEINVGEGQPNRWITLRALRGLAWYSARG